MNMEPRKSGVSFELKPSERPGLIAGHGMRWLLLLALALLTYLLFPGSGGTDFYEVGDIAGAEVIAPFEFPVSMSPGDLERQREIAEGAVLPVYEYREEVLDSVRQNASALFAALDSAVSPEDMVARARVFEIRGRDLTPEEAEYLLNADRLTALRSAVAVMINRHLSRGVPGIAFTGAEASPVILEVRDSTTERLLPRDSVYDYERFMQAVQGVSPDPNSQVGNQLLRAIVQSLFKATLVPNQVETDSLRAEARADVNPVRYTVRQNERIVDANEVVTEDIYARLAALRYEQVARGLTETDLLGTLGKILTNALVLALYWVLLMLFLPETYASFRQMGVMSLLFALVIVGAAAVVRFLEGASPALIPIPFAAMLMTVLFGGRIAMVSAMVLAVLLGPQVAYSGTNALFIALVGGVAAALSVRTVRRRNQLLVSVVVVSAAFLLVGLTVGLQVESDLMDVGSTAGLTGALGGMNALICAALVTITLPLFESLAGITTELTLLELSDPARPLLRRLATEVPGTYAHSLALANMCEAACNAIGANGLLARVGCYYHDIGKLKKPQFFVENQSPGVNPHDKLKPEVSAAMIRNHVKEGLALAKEHRLPNDVAAFIAEHHGSMVISFFLDRALTKNGESDVEPGDYRYPGPTPRSVETAVVMLADGVEAALRVLEDQSSENVSEAIDHLVRQRIDAGQLDDAPLTMAQLTRVRSEFLRVFEGARHNRIDYPEGAGGLSAGWDATSES
jgi:putative nucleotidyltransferase with HDIG domain